MEERRQGLRVPHLLVAARVEQQVLPEQMQRLTRAAVAVAAQMPLEQTEILQPMLALVVQG